MLEEKCKLHTERWDLNQNLLSLYKSANQYTTMHSSLEVCLVKICSFLKDSQTIDVNRSNCKGIISPGSFCGKQISDQIQLCH